MRLADYSLHAYRLRYARPVQWSDIVEEAAPFVLLRLKADTGHEGVAEITVKPTWGGVTARSLIAAIEEMFVPLLRTLDLGDPFAVRRTLDRIPENLAAKALIDNACWDLHAARSGTPLWKLWGGQSRVELSWAVTRQAPAAMADEAVAMIGTHGFRTLKVKGGQGLAVDVEGIAAIRNAIGDGIALYVDANGAYPIGQAADYARAVADAGAVVIEDPCPLNPDAEFVRLNGSIPIPLLVDFGCWSLRDAGLFLERGARALSVKPGRFGLSDSRLMQEMAKSADCGVVAGLMGESTLGTFAALQFASALRKPLLPAEVTWYLAMTERITTVSPIIAGGMAQMPDAASLAAMIDWPALQRYSI